VSVSSHAKALVIVAVAVVAASLVPAATARPAFSGNACTLIPASRVAALHIAMKCTPAQVAGSWRGLWTGSNGGRIYLMIVKPPANLLPQLKASATGRPVNGVGSWALDAGLSAGNTGASVLFVVGPYWVNLGVATPSKWPLKSTAPVIAMAKAIAPKLR